MKKFLLLLMTCALALGLYAQIPAGDAQPCPRTPTVTDHEGNVYNTVRIGTQCWTKENLRTTTSPSTGTYLIPPEDTGPTYTGKQARWYNNNSATYAPMNYGLLYNWNAAVDTFNTAYGETSVSTNNDNAVSVTFNGHRRGICPKGWHLPSVDEWRQLRNYVRGQSEYQCGGNSSNIAKALASTEGWNPSTNNCAVGNDPNANNATGFSAVPAGDCYGSQCGYAGTDADFWSATQALSRYADEIALNYDTADVVWSAALQSVCRSVRCLRDEPIISSTSCPGIPTVTDVDGNVYNTVKIGNQCWMKENLRTTHFADGSDILSGDLYATVSDTISLYYDCSTSDIPLEESGLLYNWLAANYACPAGWHLPTDEEWTTMEATQTTYSLSGLGWRGNHAERLAGGADWRYLTSIPDSTPGKPNPILYNASGFTAIPAGYRYNSYMESKWAAYFWTATKNTSTYAWYREVYFNKKGVRRDFNDTKFGHSVRCLKNEVPVVNTNAILGVTTTTATCGGEVVTAGGGSVTARGVCWNTSHNPTVANAHTSNGSGVGSFTGSLTGLTPGTIYYVRAYATYSEGTAYGEEVSFITQNPPCPGASTVTDQEGNVYNTIKIGNQCWMKQNMRTTKTAAGTPIPKGDEYTVSSSTPYYYNDTIIPYYEETEVVFDHVDGYYYNWVAAQTVCPAGWHLPSNTEWLSLINYVNSQNLYRCGGVDGNIIKSLSSSYGWDNGGPECSASYNQERNNATGFSAYPSGMFWSFVDDEDGERAYPIWFDHYAFYFWSSAQVNNNEGLSFFVETDYYPSEVTLDNQEKKLGLSVRCIRDSGPYINTNAVLGVTSTTATCGGEVVDAGGYYVTGRGVCWSTSHNPTVYNAYTSVGPGVGPFTCSLTGLTSETTYYVRAYATSQEGTAYGEEVSFTTLACSDPNGVSASGITTESATINWNGSSDSYLVRYRTPAQIYFKEDFESGLPSTWTTIDQDGDGHNWSSSYTPAHSGTGSVASESYDASTHAALSPDNWLITPKMDLQGVMKVWLRAQDWEYANERFAIYLSTTGNAVSDFTTTLVGETFANSTYTEYSADLSNYEGQQGYIAIRHFNCRDMLRLVVDDFGIYKTSLSDGEWRTVTSNGNSVTITGLDISTPYEVQVQGVCSGNNSEWSDTLMFITSCLPEDQCELTFVLTDSYGDGWNGNAIQVTDAESGTVLGIMANEDFNGVGNYSELTQTIPLSVCDGRTLNFEWIQGQWANETSYAVYDGNGEEIFSGSGGFTGPISYTVSCASPCPAITLPYTENFDGYTTSTTAATGAEPTCWELVQSDVQMTDANRPQLYYKSDYAHSGKYSLLLNYRGVYAMPELSEDVSVKQVKLEMYLRQPKSYYALQVGVWEDNGTFVPMATFNNSGTGLEFVECDFSDYNGNGRRIAFRNISGDNTVRNYSYNYIDDINLTNNCEPITLPYTEDFDSYTASTTAATGVEPNCWNLVQPDVQMTDANRPQLYYKSAYAHSGNYSLLLNYRGVYAMPELSSETQIPINRVKLEMYVRQPKAYYQLEVGVWNGQMFVPVQRINNSTTEVEKVTVDFSGFEGWGVIAFRNVLGDGYSYNYSYNYIDDITLTEIPEQVCGIIELPYTENFDSYTQSTTAETGVQPRCWEVTHEDVALTNATKPQVYYNATYATSGSYTLRMKNRCVYALPELRTNDPVSNLTMTFKLRQPKTVYRLQVGVVDAQGNFTSVKTINNSSTNTEEITVDFTNYTGNGRRIAFRNTVSSSSTLDYSVNYIDDITLDITPAACGIFELPYTENFDDYTQSTTAETGVQPRCWEVTHEDVALTNATKPQVYYNATYATSGSYTLRMKNRCVYALPELDVDQSVNELTMTFKLRQPKTVYRLQVGVVDAQGNFTSVKTINNSSTETEDITVDFANYTGNGRRIAFRNTVSSSSTLDYSVNYIDDITLDITPAACGIFELPYSENFDDYTASTTAETGVQPRCWEVVNEDVALTNSTKPQVYYNATYATSGSYTLRMKNRCVYALPELNVDQNVNELTMTFKLRQPKTVYRLQVGVVDAQGNFTSVKTINNSSTETEDITVDFVNYTGNGRRIAFRNTVSSSSTLDYSVNYIDNIVLDLTPASCDISNLPYAENFDSYTQSTTAETGVQPNCWEVVNEDVALTNATKPQVYYNATYATSGSYTLRMKNRCVYALPELNVNDPVSSLTMTFKLRQPKTVYRLQVGVVDAQGNFTSVKTINNSSTNTEDITVDFANYTGNGRRIAFRNTVSSSSTLDYSVNYIDDITLVRTVNNKSAEVTDATAVDALAADRDQVDVVVYPNPTKDVVNVQCTMNNVQGSKVNVQCTSIEVIDVYGKVVRTDVETLRATSLPTCINVSGLAAGMYFVRVTTDKGVVTKPFVKR